MDSTFTNKIVLITGAGSGHDFGKLPGQAAGGPVSSGQAYVVGERGPELFIPNSSGNIVPNHKLSSAMSGVTIREQNIYIEGGDPDMTADALMARWAEETRQANNAGFSFAG